VLVNDSKSVQTSDAKDIKPRRCPECTSQMQCVGVKQYLINGFVPAGRLYAFQCESGHVTHIESMSRILRWFALGAMFLWCFLKTDRRDGLGHWIFGGFGTVMALLFLYRVYATLSAPEV
jgi:hypothetical protein